MAAQTLFQLQILSSPLMYTWLRNILFLFDAEQVHNFSMNVLKGICRVPFLKKMLQNRYRAKIIITEAFGLTFRNPVGLAAGFDKNALYINELETLGFGFVEIGTVTPLPQMGNDKPRLFRLPKDKALVNRMGFNNDGVQAVATRVREWRKRQPASNSEQAEDNGPQHGIKYPGLIIGGNIGKNKLTPNDDAWKDYVTCFRELFDCVDYFVVNVSSPNTPGLRELQQKDQLEKILSGLQKVNAEKAVPKPILLKISPGLPENEVNDILELSTATGLSGIVVANTSTGRENLLTGAGTLNSIGAGGLSGRPLKDVSTKLIQYINRKTKGEIAVIGSGGIFNGNDAIEKKNAGATLLQVWTGFIYEGPSIVKNICIIL